MEPLALQLAGGETLVVPASLQSITTYVLLEQEAWFEKELGFLRRWLRPGMTAIDIGANLGVYSVAMARLVGAGGQVFAYEPGSEALGFLEKSRARNSLGNLQIIAKAVSDDERDDYLVFGASSELNALGHGEKGEPVRVTSLDAEARDPRLTTADFVKIDAEGQEERILAGGRGFFTRHSPLVMFEVSLGAEVNERLPSLFRALGYDIYRSLPDAPILVPAAAADPINKTELNLFAAKPDRARAMAQAGFLVEQMPHFVADEAAEADALTAWRQCAFAQAFTPTLPGGDAIDPDYRRGLAAYAAWRRPDVTPSAACAALNFAFRVLRDLCEARPTVARLATLARVAAAWGDRAECVKALAAILNALRSGPVNLSEPFWPPTTRFDSIPPGAQREVWFVAATAELYERTLGHSTVYSGRSMVLDWLCGQPFTCAEMARRQTLIAARAGLRPAVPPGLGVEAADNLNAALWRAGKVPGVAPM